MGEIRRSGTANASKDWKDAHGHGSGIPKESQTGSYKWDTTSGKYHYWAMEWEKAGGVRQCCPEYERGVEYEMWNYGKGRSSRKADYTPKRGEKPESPQPMKEGETMPKWKEWDGTGWSE